MQVIPAVVIVSLSRETGKSECRRGAREHSKRHVALPATSMTPRLRVTDLLNWRSLDMQPACPTAGQPKHRYIPFKQLYRIFATADR